MGNSRLPSAESQSAGMEPALGDGLRRGAPIRIRTLLVLAVLGALGWAVFPRARAAWRLQTLAGAMANYALCMVGPTGPALMRDDPVAFQKLVRRRLICAGANERPFNGCAALARDIAGTSEAERAHLATAWSFVEYGGGASDRAASGAAELTLADLRVSSKQLAELSQQAWPFVRGGYVALMRPSIAAHEAAHPVELSKPGVGSGLPAWRAHYRAVTKTAAGFVVAIGQGAHLSTYETKDGGRTWQATSARRAEGNAERCAAGPNGQSFTFSLSDDGQKMQLTSQGPDAAPTTTELGPADTQVFAAACDERALVAAFKQDSSREVSLALCPFRAACRAMPLPRFAGVGAAPRFPVDVARLGGTTVLAVTMHGIVRVASSRDDGRSWTPFSVAFDELAHPDVQTDVKRPGRLLALGDRVLLYGGASKEGQTYPVLFSDDHGASFR